MTTCYNVEKRIFFVHVPKCAGTSIGGRYDTITKEWTGCWLHEVMGGFTRENLPNGHQPVSMIEEFTDRAVDWWGKIIVPIRNPFRQQWSQYQFWRRRGQKLLDQGREMHAIHADDRYCLTHSFEEFLYSSVSAGPNRICGHQWELCGGVYRWWATDRNWQIPANVRFVRVENLREDLRSALRLANNVKRIKHVNQGDNSEALEQYTPGMVRYMRKKFAWSFAMYYEEALREAYNLVGA